MSTFVKPFRLFYWWLVAVLAGPAAAAQPAAAPVSQVFFLGSAPAESPAALARAIRALPQEPPATLVLLDDQLPRPGRRTDDSLRWALRAFAGRLVVVPTERAWQAGPVWQQQLAQALGRTDLTQPGVECPGPVEIALDARHTLVVLNTPWWLYADAQSAATGCEAQDPAAALLLLDELLRRQQATGQQVVVVGYHPVQPAAGPTPWRLLPNPGYQLFSQGLRRILAQHPGVSYVSGQPGAWQQRTEQAVHYLHAPGLSRLAFTATDSVRVGRGSGTDFSLAASWLGMRPAAPPVADTTRVSFAGQTTTARASTRYGAGPFKTWLQGANYRREWQQPVRVPVLDLATTAGGLTPLRRGGGMQTASLRLRAADGQQYVLRAVEKNTEHVVPGLLRRTLAADVVQDQISASHPYAALAVPVLAEAAGVGHTNPQLVYVPDDPRLGPYRPDFAGQLALLETREPAPPRSFTGQPEPKKYGTPQVLDQLRLDPRDQVDQRAVLRARLLDMVLADWDRHDDQWRWLAYPRPDGGRLFRAVPRDRDQAFFVNDGFLPRQASAEYVLPQLQGFAMSFRNINTFNFNARYFDRSFLTEPDRATWRALADSVRASLSDTVLEAALRRWPDSIYQLSGPQILAKLRAHRDQLPTWAEQYYLFLAREVDVVGSDADDYVEVIRLDDARTQVSLYARQPDGQPGARRYRRTFLAAETREIRLYGLGGHDVFVLSGQVRAGPLVRIIGGPGPDELLDRSAVAGLRRHTRGYDEPGGLSAQAGPETRLRLRPREASRPYERKTFQYPFRAPLFPWGYNVDDGVFLGLGLVSKRPGFRKAPWAAVHTLTGNVALATGAFNFGYEGQLTRAVGPFDLALQAVVQAPNYVRNFYGLGNNTAPEPGRDVRYYRVRFHHVTATALLRRQLGPRWQVFGGPTYQYVQVQEQADRVLHQVQDARLRPAELFQPKQYAGLRLGLGLTGRRVRASWPQGASWQTSVTALRPLTRTARPLTQLTSELAVYRSWRAPLRLTLAARLGGTSNLGDYEFFQAATLGGLSNLRGYRRTRFAGRHAAYLNAEARLQLGSVRTYVLPLTFGVLGFHDAGRVWVPGETSRTWHRGYGAGLWLRPAPQLLLCASYGFSREDRLPLIRAGFFF